MINFNRFILTTIMILTLFAAGGCTAVALEAGNKVYTHLRGDFLGIVPDKLPDVYAATISALKKNAGFTVNKKELNSLTGHIIALDENQRQVQVDLFRTEFDQTRIQIRIGALGDKIESVAIYDDIKKHLSVGKTTNVCLF